MSSFLLKEDSFYLLQETGDKILLEQSTADPTATTGLVTSIRRTTATVTGNNTSDGSSVTARGVVISTHISPTIADTIFLATGSSGSFDISLINLVAGTQYYVRAFMTDSSGTVYGDNVFFTTASVNPRKTFFYKVYSYAGVYITTWTSDVISEPRFTMNINGGAGQLLIRLARSFDGFGEGVDVILNNRVECYVVDKDNVDGLLIYSGYVSGYRPIIEGVKEMIEVTLFSFVAEFGRMILQNAAGVTTWTYNSYDPANILKDVIDKYRQLGGRVNYTPTSIELTNTVVSYTFNTNTIKECVDKIIELCPAGWYWRVDPDGTIHLHPKPDVQTHTFKLGDEIEQVQTTRQIDDLVNTVYFVGGGSPPLYRIYRDLTSIATYGRYEIKYVDERVTVVATSSTISNGIINARKDPEVRSHFVIVDNNGPQDNGYDIETIKVGQTLKIANITPGLLIISVIQIISTTYSPDDMELDASSRLPQISKRIEDINRNLENSQTVNNPSSPS